MPTFHGLLRKGKPELARKAWSSPRPDPYKHNGFTELGRNSWQLHPRYCVLCDSVPRLGVNLGREILLWNCKPILLYDCESPACWHLYQKPHMVLRSEGIWQEEKSLSAGDTQLLLPQNLTASQRAETLPFIAIISTWPLGSLVKPALCSDLPMGLCS